jgi:DNA-binding LacI/PurR family transcriptional regulator
MVKALSIFRELGISIPEDLSVVTHSNKGSPILSGLTLSRVEADPRKAGELAFELLHDLMNNRTVKDRIVDVPLQVIEGASVLRR